MINLLFAFQLLAQQPPCTDFSGNFVIQGEDGRVAVQIQQMGCARITIAWESSLYPNKLTCRPFADIGWNAPDGPSLVWWIRDAANGRVVATEQTGAISEPTFGFAGFSEIAHAAPGSAVGRRFVRIGCKNEFGIACHASKSTTSGGQKGRGRGGSSI